MLTIDQIAEAYRKQVSVQDYSPREKIAGVQVVDLRLMLDDGGSFAELVRLNEKGCLEAFPEFQVRQSSYSLVLPGSIKAFHLHYKQDDVWFVPPTERLLMGLLDVRQDSDSCNVSQRFVLGGGKAQLLYIPCGVAHGCANLGTVPASIIYFVNQQFSLEKSDENRLPWDILGKDFWELTRG